MKRERIIGVSLILVILVVAACAPKIATPAPQAPALASAATPALAPAKAAAQAPAPAAPARPAWETKWEQTLEAAKKEGSVVLYTVVGGQQRQILTNAFTSKYGVRLEAVTGASSTVPPKIAAEQRAGIYSADVWIGGSASYVPFKGLLDSLEPWLILPELTEPELIKKTWYFGEISWGDKARTMLTSLMDFKESMSINTNLVKPGEITGYSDLLDPKWKGKISLNDPRVSGNGRMWFAAVLELRDVDVNYMRELATRQEVFITRDWRLQVEWLAHGKHAVAIAPYTATVTEFMALGAPVNRFNSGTPFITGSTSGTAIMKRPPHPNAARLFLNWDLSQEGQTFHSRIIGAQSQRLDVPTTHLEASKVLGPGLKLYRADNEEFAIKKDTDYAKLANEIFGLSAK